MDVEKEEETAGVKKPLSNRPTTSGGLEELKKAKLRKGKEKSELQKCLDEEKALKTRVNKLRAELLQSRSTTAMHRSAVYHLHMADAEKADMLKLKGLDQLKKKRIGGKGVKRASETDLHRLSAALKKEHDARAGRLDPAVRNWFGMFKSYDTNNDNHISFAEFERMVRTTIGVNDQKVTRKSLVAAWRALDDDEDGLIDAGAFGRLYRKAEIGQQLGDFAVRRKEVESKARQGFSRAPPMFVGIVGDVAKEMHFKSRATVEKDVATPMQEARIEARKFVKRLGEEEKRLQVELRKIVKEKTTLEKTLSSRGALRSAYGGLGGMSSTSSLAASLTASRSSLKSPSKVEPEAEPEEAYEPDEEDEEDEGAD